MIKEAFAWVEERLRPETVEANGRTFIRSMAFDEVRPEEELDRAPRHLKVYTLEALADYILADPEGHGGEVFVHIEDARTVSVLSSGAITSASRERHTRCVATAAGAPVCLSQLKELEHSCRVENFLTMARQGFHTDLGEFAELAALLSNLEGGSVRTTRDDGMSQEVHTRKSVGSVEREKVKPEWTLYPKGTFRGVKPAAATFAVRFVSSGDEVPAVKLVWLDQPEWGEAQVVTIGDRVDDLLGESTDGIVVLR